MPYTMLPDHPPIMLLTDHALITRLVVQLEQNTIALNAAVEQLGNTRLTETEAAQYLGVEKRTLYSYRQRGLPYNKVGRQVSYLRKDLDAFRNEGRVNRQ